VIPADALVVVVDMQRLFAEATPWRVPEFESILPNIQRLVRRRPERTIFTRFLVPESPEAAFGSWRGYYRRWTAVTLRELDPAMQDLVPALRTFAPPGTVADKTTYSAFASGDFIKALARLGGDHLVLSGVETDVCVLATALAAVDRGLAVTLATDAVASGSRPSHEAMLARVYPRLPDQIAPMTTDAILAAWRS
jgi:nicotinamidase-related amidase